MSVPLADTEYIKRMVGDALAKGCAATMAANPADPVEFLGQWLLQQAKVKDIQDQLQQQLELAAQSAEKKQAEAAAAAEQQQQFESRRQDALDSVAAVKSDLWELWQKAVAVAASETQVGAAYLAAVSEAAPALPEIAETEEESELVEEPATAPPEAAPAAEGSAEGAEEGEPAAEAPAAGEEGEEEETGPPKPDYSRKNLEYVVTSSGQEWMLEQSTALQRPAAPAEDVGEEVPAAPTCPTFRLLDEGLPFLYLPNVSYARTIVFFKQFPRVGAYWACSLKGAQERLEAVLAADSLMPPGNGRPFSDSDRQFLGKLAEVVAANMAELAAQRAEQAAGGSGKQAVYDLEKRLAQLEAATTVEPYTGEDLKESLKAAEAAAAKAVGKLEAIQEVVKAQGSTAAGELLALPCAPPLTWNMLRALLLVLGRPSQAVDTWLKCRSLIRAELFEEAGSRQGPLPLPTGEPIWQEVRGRLAAGQGSRKALAEECPSSSIGALLAMLLQQTRRVDKATAESTRAKKACDDADAAAAAAAAEAARLEEEAKAAAAAQKAEEEAAAAQEAAEKGAADAEAADA